MFLTILFVFLAHFIVDTSVGIWPLFKTMAGIDLQVAGFIAGFCGFVGEGTQVIFGYFCDRGRRKQILILGVMLSSAIFFLSLANGIFLPFLILLSAMLGSGAFHPAAIGFIGSLSDKNKGKLILGFAFAGALGQGSSQLFYVSLFKDHPERTIWVFMLIAILLFIVYRYRFTHTPPSREKLNLQQFFAPFRTKRRPLLLLYFSQIASQGLVLAFLFLLPDLLKEKSCDIWLCHGGGQFVFLLGASLALLPTGVIIDRFGLKPVMLIVCSLSIVIFYAVLFLPVSSSWVTALFLAAFGASIWMINPTIVTWGNKLVPESPSFVSGLLMGMAWCISHLVTIVSGALTKCFDNACCHGSMQLLGMIILLPLIFTLFMPKEEEVVQTVIANK